MSVKLAVIFLSFFNCGWAVAQTFLAPEDHEEALLRLELERIVSENPREALHARKALRALDTPKSESGSQVRNRGPRGERRIVNGLPVAAGHPAVGALLKGSDRRAATAWCTGTLVGCSKFLTAAHCIEKDPRPGSYLIFFQELGFFEVSKIAWPKEEYRFPYFDLAMLTLARPVEGVAPMSVNVHGEPLNKSVATIVGFGRTGGDRYDYGIKREGSVRTEMCSPSRAKQKLLCWKYDADIKSRRSRSNTCNGDSGGGVFMFDREEAGARRVTRLFGVVSGGRDGACVRDDESYNVNVFEFRKWIEQASEGALSSQMCGPPMGQSGSKREVLTLSKESPQKAISLEVPPGMTMLRVAMNAVDDGFGNNDFNLLLFPPIAPSQNVRPACEDSGPGQFGFCEINRPEPGTWSVLVQRKKGRGQVQITATLVGGS